jgi:hypothetical protein
LAISGINQNLWIRGSWRWKMQPRFSFAVVVDYLCWIRGSWRWKMQPRFSFAVVVDYLCWIICVVFDYLFYLKKTIIYFIIICFIIK